MYILESLHRRFFKLPLEMCYYSLARKRIKKQAKMSDTGLKQVPDIF